MRTGRKFSCCFRGSSAALPHQKMAAAAPPSDKFSKTDGLFYFHVSFIIKIKAFFSVLARYECNKLNLKRGGRRWSWCENQTIVNCVNPFLSSCTHHFFLRIYIWTSKRLAWKLFSVFFSLVKWSLSFMFT